VSDVRRVIFPIVFLFLFLGLVGCQQKMATQGKLRTFQSSSRFEDGALARPKPDGTVPRGAELSESVAQGMAQGGRGVLLQKNPLPVNMQLLKRGQQRFQIYCSPCHGDTGAGNGMVVQRGFPRPPSYHIDRLRTAPDGYLFHTITQGIGGMYSYADRISVEDRWAIVAYIRALQKSQNTRVGELTNAERVQLEGSHAQ
jgi:mono/diheme cytochrome c family protein